MHNNKKEHYNREKMTKPSPCLSLINLSANFGKLLVDQQFSDVTLVIDQQKIPAHKNILVARCPVFAAMFNSDLEESKTNVVNIMDFSYDAVEEMIQFIYTGLTGVKFALVAKELLRLADKYFLSDLKGLCEKQLIASVTVDSAAELLILGHMHEAKALKEKSLSVVISNKNVCKTDGWKELLHKPELATEVFERSFDKNEIMINCMRRQPNNWPDTSKDTFILKNKSDECIRK